MISQKNSPAEKAGLRRGDVIIELNGKAIKDVESLRNMVAQSDIGSTIKLLIMRAGKTIQIAATIVELPKEVSDAGEKSNEAPSGENGLAGLSVIELTPEIAKQLGLPRDERGVVVVRVDPDSTADDAGLKKGDVIQEINKRTVSNLSEFNAAARRIREGDVLLLVNRGGHRLYVTIKSYS